MPGRRGDRGGERRLVDADHSRADLLQRPAPAAGAAAEIEAGLAGPGPAADQGQRLPQFQIGPARRPCMVLDKARFRRSETGSCNAAPPASSPASSKVHEPSGADRRRCAEDQRLGRDLRQLFLDQRRAPVQNRRVDRPVALDRAQFRRRIRDRLDRDLLRIEPHIGGPRRETRRSRARSAGGRVRARPRPTRAARSSTYPSAAR